MSMRGGQGKRAQFASDNRLGSHRAAPYGRGWPGGL